MPTGTPDPWLRVGTHVAEGAPRMRSVVTGGAGFIGSTLSEALLSRGHEVVAIDRFNNNYDPAIKESNVRSIRSCSRYELITGDLLAVNLDKLLDGADFVFHQAGQPGVRSSWAAGFRGYCDDNVLATQRLLEATRRHSSIKRVVYASSSSIYGNAPRWPTTERDRPSPISPYGVTKLAAEHLCTLYAVNHAVPVASLRYFTVYGPRQRPDMAINRLVRTALLGETFTLFGDGSHIRDFTFVGDIVRANILACESDLLPGTVMNVAGTDHVSMLGLIGLVEELAGATLPVQIAPEVPGDAKRTGGSIDRARDLMGWEPQVSLRDGLAQQIDWQRSQLAGLIDFAPA